MAEAGLTRRRLLKTAAFTTCALALPFAHGPHAAGRLSAFFCDHPVPSVLYSCRCPPICSASPRCCCRRPDLGGYSRAPTPSRCNAFRQSPAPASSEGVANASLLGQSGFAKASEKSGFV